MTHHKKIDLSFKDLPLVSIIVPTDHSAPHLAMALHSLKEQSYPYLEVIFIDNHSTDETPEIIQNFISQCPYSTTFLKDQFKSPIHAINRGLSLAKGDYLTLLPPQDSYHPSRIEKLIERASLSPLHFLFTRVDLIDQNNSKQSFDVDDKRTYEHEIFNIIHLPSIEYAFLSTNIALSYGNMFFSRQLFNQVGPFNDYAHHSSLDFILRALMHYELSFFNEMLYCHRFLKTLSKEEKKLSQNEQEQIYLNYLIAVNTSPPANPNAPSKFYWPEAFLKALEKMDVSHILKKFIQKPAKIPPSSKTLPLTPSLKRPTNKKISLITHDLATGGGGPKLVLDLAILLRSHGFDVSVMTMRDGPLKKDYQASRIPLSIFPLQLLRWSENQGKIKRLVALFLSNLYLNIKTSSHVIINSAASASIALPLAFFSPFKKIQWYIHESFSPGVYLKNGLSQKLLKKANKDQKFSFWFGSESTKNIWNSVLDVSGKVLYWSGLSSTLPLNKSVKPIKHLLSIGYSTPRKGFHFLVDAFISCIQKKNIPDDVVLTLVGFPNNLDSYNQEIILKIMSSGHLDRINLVSCIDIDELQTFYDQADLFIQPSVLECLPLSLLQAMSQGIPVLSTDVNGCREAITHLHSGYLCNSFSAKSLEDALVEIIHHPEETRERAVKAQQVFNEKFSAEITISKIIEQLT